MKLSKAQTRVLEALDSGEVIVFMEFGIGDYIMTAMMSDTQSADGRDKRVNCGTVSVLHRNGFIDRRGRMTTLGKAYLAADRRGPK